MIPSPETLRALGLADGVVENRSGAAGKRAGPAPSEQIGQGHPARNQIAM
jgi:hypothetical protein